MIRKDSALFSSLCINWNEFYYEVFLSFIFLHTIVTFLHSIAGSLRLSPLSIKYLQFYR